MKYRSDVDQFASESDKPILLWLASRYGERHIAKWRLVAYARHERYGTRAHEVNIVWAPTAEGRLLYESRERLSVLQDEELRDRRAHRDASVMLPHVQVDWLCGGRNGNVRMNPHLAPPGCVAIKVTALAHCFGCVFEFDHVDACSHRKCRSCDRPDNTDVRFVPATATVEPGATSDDA